VSRDPLGPPAAPPPAVADELLDDRPETSLLDLVDNLLDRGVLTRGEVVLGLAGVDLIYLRLSALLCAADRVLPASGAGGEQPPGGPPGPPEALVRESPAAAERGAEPAEPASPASAPTAASAPSTGPGVAGDDVHPLGTDELDALRGELETRTAEASPARWNADPENAQRAVAKLVLTLVDFLRQLMERQAIRRMEAGTVTEDEVERLGLALMRLEETLHEMAARFGIPPEDLNLDLGPLGRLT
jgi:hypothetical protein